MGTSGGATRPPARRSPSRCQCDIDPNGLAGTTATTTGYTAGGTELTLLYPSCCGDSYVGENVTFTRQ